MVQVAQANYSIVTLLSNRHTNFGLTTFNKLSYKIGTIKESRRRTNRAEHNEKTSLGEYKSANYRERSERVDGHI